MISAATARKVYAALVREVDRNEYWDAHQSCDYPPWTVRIVIAPKSDGRSTAMYFPEAHIVEIYRRGLAEPIDSAVGEAAAQATEPLLELIYLAHELGHHLSVVRGLGSGVFDASRPLETYREEIWAWAFARYILKEGELQDWSDFEAHRANAVLGYREGLKLRSEEAKRIEEEVLHDFAQLVPANSGLQPTWRSLALAPRS